MALKASPMDTSRPQAISRGDSGRTPGKPETTPTGKLVGKKPVTKLSRYIAMNLKASKKGHKRMPVRPIHQGATFSQKFLRPQPRGVADRSRNFSFGDVS